jgi:4-hydroxy-3-methylbut-2-enyl diphosphate reductase
MKILLAETMGFCQGVKRAVTIADESGKGSYVLGQLTHNPQVNKALKEKGLQTAGSLYGIPEGSRVIFRAHGEPPHSYAVAQNRSLQVIDATCPHVKNAQLAGQKLAQESLSVLIVGDPAHPEVMSVKAWSGGRAAVVQNREDVERLPEGECYGLIAQTTCTEEMFDELSALIVRKNARSKVVKTICPATSKRQAAALKLAREADAVVVIGGKNSANTGRLKELVEKYCQNTIRVETAQELSADMFSNTKIVGVTAGASTPDWIIKEVVTKMENMKELIDSNDEVKELSAGDIIQGKVVSVGKDEVIADINYKSEGVIPREEAALNPPEDLTVLLTPGDVISVMVLDPDRDGGVLLSRVRAEAETAIEKLN